MSTAVKRSKMDDVKPKRTKIDPRKLAKAPADFWAPIIALKPKDEFKLATGYLWDWILEEIDVDKKTYDTLINFIIKTFDDVDFRMVLLKCVYIIANTILHGQVQPIIFKSIANYITYYCSEKIGIVDEDESRPEEIDRFIFERIERFVCNLPLAQDELVLEDEFDLEEILGIHYEFLVHGRR